MSLYPEIFPYSLTPTEVADISDVPPDVIRDWRHRGLIDVYGIQHENGRWSYSMRDAVALGLAMKLIHAAKIDRAKAASLGYTLAPHVIRALKGEPFPAYLASIYTEEPSGLVGWEFREVSSLAEISHGMIVELTNVAAVAKSVSPETREAVTV